jgi:hypothetical protein
VTVDAALNELTRRAVTGLLSTDFFLDLAWDGDAGLWAVRPAVNSLPARLVKIDLASATVVLGVTPPDATMGGVVFHQGSLWGAGATALYEMIP